MPTVRTVCSMVGVVSAFAAILAGCSANESVTQQSQIERMAGAVEDSALGVAPGIGPVSGPRPPTSCAHGDDAKANAQQLKTQTYPVKPPVASATSWANCQFPKGMVLENRNLAGVSFAAAQLSGVTLSGVNAARADFSSANLSDATITSSKLVATKLAGAKTSGLTVLTSNLKNADLTGLTSGFNATTVNFTGATLDEKTSFRERTLHSITGLAAAGANFQKATFIGVSSLLDFATADLRDAVFDKSTLTDVNFNKAKIGGISLVRITARNVLLGLQDPAELTELTLTPPPSKRKRTAAVEPAPTLTLPAVCPLPPPATAAPTEGHAAAQAREASEAAAKANAADIERNIRILKGWIVGTAGSAAPLNFDNCDLSGASIGPRQSLVNISFKDATLVGAKLTGAVAGDFTKANLRGATISSSGLALATLTGADLREAVFTTEPPADPLKLAGAQLRDAQFPLAFLTSKASPKSTPGVDWTGAKAVVRNKTVALCQRGSVGFCRLTLTGNQGLAPAKPSASATPRPPRPSTHPSAPAASPATTPTTTSSSASVGEAATADAATPAPTASGS